MDYLSLVGFVVSGLAGWFLRGWLRPVIKVETRTIIPSPGPDGVYVRFTFADGRVEVKKFRATDLDLLMEWRGRSFSAGEWTPDGQVYNEVVN